MNFPRCIFLAWQCTPPRTPRSWASLLPAHSCAARYSWFLTTSLWHVSSSLDFHLFSSNLLFNLLHFWFQRLLPQPPGEGAHVSLTPSQAPRNTCARVNPLKSGKSLRTPEMIQCPVWSVAIAVWQQIQPGDCDFALLGGKRGASLFSNRHILYRRENLDVSLELFLPLLYLDLIIFYY